MIRAWNNFYPGIHAKSWVAENATIIGRVEIGEQSSIWFGTVLRGDIEPIRVGAGSNIQDNSVLHTSSGFPVEIGCGVTVGHQATLHGCSVGDHCLIGMKAILLDGCVIGDNCLIGAGTLIKQHQVIPPNSLVVGCPGRVIRKLTNEEIDGLRQSARRYIDLYESYITSG
jgi:carbonic anhydrase/acetyltransferase-like protein (isoleucine patch superfamily)